MWIYEYTRIYVVIHFAALSVLYRFEFSKETLKPHANPLRSHPYVDDKKQSVKTCLRTDIVVRSYTRRLDETHVRKVLLAAAGYFITLVSVESFQPVSMHINRTSWLDGRGREKGEPHGPGIFKDALEFGTLHFFSNQVNNCKLIKYEKLTIHLSGQKIGKTYV